MATEAMIPVSGWLAVLSQPMLGLWLRGRRGLAAGAASTALLVLGPVLVKTDWNSSASTTEFLSGCGYFFAVTLTFSAVTIALWPIIAPIALPTLLVKVLFGVSSEAEAQTLSFMLAFLGSVTLACALQALVWRRLGENALLVITSLEALFFGSFWMLRSYFARITVQDGDGYNGLFELMAYMNSIAICALFAVYLVALANLRPTRVSSI